MTWRCWSAAASDSAVLCVDLLRQFDRVWPIYVRFGLRWEGVELRAFATSSTRSRRRRRVYARSRSWTSRSPSLRRALEQRRPAGCSGVETPPTRPYICPGRTSCWRPSRRSGAGSASVETLAFGTLKGNPFPDSTAGASSTGSRRSSTGRWTAGSGSSVLTKGCPRSRSSPRRRAPAPPDHVVPQPGRQAPLRALQQVRGACSWRSGTPAGRSRRTIPRLPRLPRAGVMRRVGPSTTHTIARVRHVPSVSRDRILLRPPAPQLRGQVPPPPRA